MSRNAVEIVLGAVVLAVAMIFLAFAYSSAQIQTGSEYEVTAKFDHVDGIRDGGDVRMSGIKVGAIRDQTLDPKTYQAIVRMRIDDSVQIPVDTVASITSSGLLGDKYMSLVPGGDDNMIKPGGEITHTQAPISLESILRGVFSMTGGNKSGDSKDQGSSAAPSPTAGPAPVPALPLAPDQLPALVRHLPPAMASPDDLAAGQRWDPVRYARDAAFVPVLGAPVFDLLAPRPGEHILDLGCGDGVLTEKLAAVATVVGVDASPEQVEAAKARGLDARVMSGDALIFANEFDAVFSNAALHWMRAAEAVLDGVARSLKPGGRFAGEMGGIGNTATILEALLAALAARGIDGQALWPWYFPSLEEYRGRLEHAGFEISSIALILRPTPLPGRLAAWLETFAVKFLDAVPATEHPALLAEIEAAVAPKLRDASGNWTADYVRLRFLAVKR